MRQNEVSDMASHAAELTNSATQHNTKAQLYNNEDNEIILSRTLTK